MGTTVDVSVVLPTFNEALSLPHLIPRIHDVLQSAGLYGEVIVVDDDSPDGTAEVARRLTASYRVRTVKRTSERGLATAVLAGFELSQAEVCVVMDADGSHPVEVLPQMVAMILRDEADVVVGSRRVEGGGSQDWPWFSRIKSRLAALLARGLSGMTDPTTGFMAVRRSLLRGVHLDPLGWKIVLEVVVKTAPARLEEIPIVFSGRIHGESKQNLSVFWEYVRHCARLYHYRIPSVMEFVKFCIVGGLGVFVDLAAVVVLKELAGLDTRFCATGGFLAAVTSNYLLNRYWTFKDAVYTPFWRSYGTYVVMNVFGLLVRLLTVHVLMTVAGLDSGYWYIVTNLAGIALATLVNFAGVKYFAFDPDSVLLRGPGA